MESSMAESFASKGFEVTIFDIAQEFLDKAMALIDIHQQTLVKTGEISHEDSPPIRPILIFANLLNVSCILNITESNSSNLSRYFLVGSMGKLKCLCGILL